jgi:hypothetical protein
VNTYTNATDGNVGDSFLDAKSFAQLRSGNDLGEVASALLQTLSRLNPGFEQIVLVLADGPTAKLQPAGV